MKELPSAEVLTELLDYRPKSGKLFWKFRPLRFFETQRGCNIWNGKNAGKEAFTSINKGYRQGRIFSQTHRAHRVIWAIHTGAWPKDNIDHVDGNRLNNAWVNLREASKTENNRNRSASRNSKSGHKGVFWYKAGKKWHAQITAERQRFHLGYFDEIDDAKAAYQTAAAALHGEFARVSK
jgi:hypothetical protein